MTEIDRAATRDVCPATHKKDGVDGPLRAGTSRVRVQSQEHLYDKSGSYINCYKFESE